MQIEQFFAPGRQIFDSARKFTRDCRHSTVEMAFQWKMTMNKLIIVLKLNSGDNLFLTRTTNEFNW